MRRVLGPGNGNLTGVVPSIRTLADLSRVSSAVHCMRRVLGPGNGNLTGAVPSGAPFAVLQALRSGGYAPCTSLPCACAQPACPCAGMCFWVLGFRVQAQWLRALHQPALRPCAACVGAWLACACYVCDWG